MSDLVQVLGVVISTLLLLLVLELVRRRKLTEEYSLIWILCSLLLLVLSVWRESLHITAAWLGIFYPPMVLLLFLVLFVFLGLLHVSVINSHLRRQVERLAEEVAIIEATVRPRKDAEPERQHGEGEVEEGEGVGKSLS